MTSVAVCIASFNRRSRTLLCLDRLFSAELPENTELVVHLLDDASPDGTAAAVAERFPQVRLHHGDGQRYWAGGMRIAYGAALAAGHDYYLWLNDDVELFSDTIKRAIQMERELRRRHGGEHVIVGAMCARDGKTTTYGGLVSTSAILPWKFALIPPNPNQPIECDTLNANFVLVPDAVARKVGNIDPGFVQFHADLVLGLMARRVGARNWVLAGHVGICDANVAGRKNWRAPGLGLAERLKLMEHPLGYPLKGNIAFSRYFGPWGPLMIISPYLKFAAAALREFMRSARGSPS